MGLLLNLAVVALVIIVLVSLALLAWTVGVTASQRAGRARSDVAQTRARIRGSDQRMAMAALDAHRAMGRGSRRIGTQQESSATHDNAEP